MRKLFILLLVLAALLAAALPGLADSYKFPQIFMVAEIPLDYMVQLTNDSMDQYTEYLSSIGETPESMRQRFKDEGILVWAYNEEKDRTIVITAVQDDTAQQLYDINEQTAQTRAGYRANYQNGVFYSKADYSFESVEWKDFGDNQGRFLMIRYTHKVDGKVAWKGEWRRTIRNGYTITVDLRVGNRNVKGADIDALNVIQNSIAFVLMTEAPEALLTLAFSAPPPESTNSDSFTIKGTTRPGASVVAAYAALQSGQSKAIPTTADGMGAFSIDVKLPGKDLYNLLVSVAVNEGTEDEQTINRDFSVEYDPAALPVSFITLFPDVFTADSFKLTGTTLTGVTIQLVVNNQLQTKKTGDNRTFSFTVDTAKEGDYDIQLTFSKKEYDTKIMSFHIRREMDEGQRRQSIRDESRSPDYSNIASSPDRYVGRVLRYKGYVTEVAHNGAEWVVTFATEKSGSRFRNLIIALSNTEIAADPDTQVTMYGTMTGTYSSLDENGKEQQLPRMTLSFID
ncbi:MAG: hypothetical protein IJ157_08945 [Clostridia bacterium]|nr:hypothetical protein [Clostridia bacterium]